MTDVSTTCAVIIFRVKYSQPLDEIRPEEMNSSLREPKSIQGIKSIMTSNLNLKTRYIKLLSTTFTPSSLLQW